MKLSKATLRPGNVLEVLDGYKIKAQAPGLFTAEDSLEDLPPIMPWPGGVNTGAWSEPEPGQEVWILNLTDNPAELFWFRKDRLENGSGAAPATYGEVQNVEVLCDREIGPGQWATIYFSDGTGWIIRNGSVQIQLADKGIVLDAGTPGRKIEINDEGIHLGGGPLEEPAVLGTKLQQVLENIYATLDAVANAASMNMMTAPIGTVIKARTMFADTMVANITSGTVLVNP